MPRFVVLTHDHPFLHWDLMLETAEGLRTWRLHEPPDTPADIVAEALPLHRSAYLDYEGPISGGRGTVSRWDAGTYCDLTESTDAMTVRLTGERLSGDLLIAASPTGGLQAGFTPSSVTPDVR